MTEETIIAAKQAYESKIKITGEKKVALDFSFQIASMYEVDLDFEEYKQIIQKEVEELVETSHVMSVQSSKINLTDPTNKSINWDYWSRYKSYLFTNKKWNNTIVRELHNSTNTIIENLGNPNSNDPFSKKGLVVGYVQSGKTANYIGLINKAFDIEYKIIIVMAGIHNDLRRQTQQRIDTEVLGYNTSIDFVGKNKKIGVDNIKKLTLIDSLTTQDIFGDISGDLVQNIHIKDDSKIILVIKKNTFVLSHTIEYFRNQIKDSPVLKNAPLLLIDDEADQASLNINNNIKYNKEGLIDDESLSTINNHILSLLNLFNKNSYVGYTATPFANILVDPKHIHKEYGAPLFPKDFIISLPKPESYFGPVELFGIHDDNIDIKEKPLIEIIPEQDIMNLDNYDDIEFLPPSLITAIHMFILTCAIRTYTKDNDHNSMLVHIDRLQNTHAALKGLIRNAVGNMYEQESSGLFYTQLKKLFEDNITPKLNDFKVENFPSWENIFPIVNDIVGSIKILEINSSSDDILNYSLSKEKLNVIVIGGDKLSRGLTLEGLSINYFLRGSKMYDSLMQMGRWFGYKKKYIHLCRLFTSVSIANWFKHVTSANEEMLIDFKKMVMQGKTPKDYLLKIKSHPELLVTNRAKIGDAEEYNFSYSDRTKQTVVLDLDSQHLSHNYRATDDLIKSLNYHNTFSQEKENYVWKNVTKTNIIIDYLKKLNYSSYDVITSLMGEYIESQNMQENPELTEWTVSLISNSLKNTDKIIMDGLEVYCAKRTISPTRYKMKANIGEIGALLTPEDMLLGLDDLIIDQIYQSSQQEYFNDYKVIPKTGYFKLSKVREYLTPKQGLLLLYPIDKTLVDEKIFQDGLITKKLELDVAPFGIVIVFPETKNKHLNIKYVIPSKTTKNIRTLEF